jgi:hypothetical protein
VQAFENNHPLITRQFSYLLCQMHSFISITKIIITEQKINTLNMFHVISHPSELGPNLLRLAIFLDFLNIVSVLFHSLRDFCRIYCFFLIQLRSFLTFKKKNAVFS